MLFLATGLFPSTIDVYFTEDGQKIQSIRGYPINEDLTLSQEGDESWLVSAGFQIGPNGYMAKQSRLTLGNLGKTKALFVRMSEAFTGIGSAKRFERAVPFEEIAFILPDAKALEPFYVKLRNGNEGQLFVAGDYTESQGERVIQGKPVNWISVIQLKYDMPVSSRTASTRPKQFAFKAQAVAFSEQGIKQAIRALRSR